MALQEPNVLRMTTLRAWQASHVLDCRDKSGVGSWVGRASFNIIEGLLLYSSPSIAESSVSWSRNQSRKVIIIHLVFYMSLFRITVFFLIISPVRNHYLQLGRSRIFAKWMVDERKDVLPSYINSRTVSPTIGFSLMINMKAASIASLLFQEVQQKKSTRFSTFMSKL